MQKYVNLIAFLKKLISKEHIVVIMEIPDWVQVEKIYYTLRFSINFQIQILLPPCIMSVQYTGWKSLSTPRVFSTLGDIMSTSGVFSTLGDTPR